MKKIFSALMGLLIAASCAQKAAYIAPDAAGINSIEDLQAYLTYSPERDILISGHRGGVMPGFPENCIESCEKTLSLLPAMFEIDFSFTKDSVMAMMHDLTIDRTTTGHGRVADYTYEELRQFNLVDRNGDVTPYKIPTLIDVLEWGQNKVIFNFDNKYINTKGVSEEEKHAALEYYAKQLLPGGAWEKYHNIVICVRTVDELLFYWNKGIRNVMFFIEIGSPEAYELYKGSGVPWNYLCAYIRMNVNPEMCKIYKELHDNGVMIMTSVAGSSDKIKNNADRRVAYLRDLISEPDILETDYPSEFVDLPRTRAEIHALQDECIRINR